MDRITAPSVTQKVKSPGSPTSWLKTDTGPMFPKDRAGAIRGERPGLRPSGALHTRQAEWRFEDSIGCVALPEDQRDAAHFALVQSYRGHHHQAEDCTLVQQVLLGADGAAGGQA
ncbi:unnamed protein product [Durusdinium trenchii]|uniref:Uncharacterized protein n=2 Tax=Durusdinium trenchii TaxID=1381693 RepID=A0ABP0J9C1_9DINO